MSTLHVELLRGRHFPQTEDDPNPCTTQVRVLVYSENYADVLAPEECSSIQERSNDPFYKDTVSLNLQDDYEGAAILLVKVVEYTRQSAPVVLLCGEVRFTTQDGKSKKEVLVPLTYSSPIDAPQQAAAEREAYAALSGTQAEKYPMLNLKYNLVRRKSDEQVDPNADVVITHAVSFDGSVQVVPANSQYAWVRLTSDKRWHDAFSRALIAAWKSRAPLEQHADAKKVKRSKSKTDTNADPALREPRSIGEIVERKWCCRRSHQILTRLRMCADKFAQGDTNLTFSLDEERVFRTEKKERAMLLEDMCQSALGKSSNPMKDTIDRLWTVFATGIDLDPTGPKTLSYEMRKRVHDTTFTEADAVVLEACLIYCLIPTLPFEKCQFIAEEDFRKTSLRPVAETNNFEGSLNKVTESQRKFTQVLTDFLGPLMDTLTAAEWSKIAKVFKPAVMDANKRISKGGTEDITRRLREHKETGPKVFGDGIPIEHLDKYGHRKKAVQFA